MLALGLQKFKALRLLGANPITNYVNWDKANNKLHFIQSELHVGAFSSATHGSGVAISAARTAAVRFYGDDNNVALTSGTYRVGISRMLITKAATADVTVHGFEGHIKVGAVAAALSWISGVWAYAETVASGTVGAVFAGLRATVDVPTSGVIASGGVACGVAIDSISLAGTHTGKAACVYVPNPGAGTWDFFAKFGAATGCFSGNTNKGAEANELLIDINGTTFRIPVYANS